MSRNNSSIIREIRNVENQKLRKTILKASGASARVSSDVFDQLSDSNQQYLEKISQLKNFNKRSKTQLHTQTHQNEWKSEYQRLQQLALKLEEATLQTLQNVLLMSPDIDEVHRLVDDSRSEAADRKSRKDGMVSQLREMKDLLRMACRRGIHHRSSSSSASSDGLQPAVRQSSTAPGSGEASDRQPQQMQQSQAILASMLLRARNGLSERWQLLSAEEARLAAVLKTARVKIFAMLREDRTEQQDQALRAEFEQLLDRGPRGTEGEGDEEGDEEAELQLQAALQHWLGRIAQLDLQHKLALQAADADRLQLGQQMGLRDPLDPQGDWPAADHDTFHKVFKKAHVSGMLRKKLMDSLQMQLPHRSHEELCEHEEWYRALRVLQQRSQEQTASYLEQREGLVAQARADLEQQRGLCEQQRLRAQEAQQLQRRSAALHSKLEELRALHAQQSAAEQAEQQRTQALQQLQTLEEQAAAAEFRRQQREQVEKFRAQRAEALAEQRRAQQQQAEAEQQQLKQAVEASRERVQDRNARLLQKEEARRLAEEQKLLDEEMHRLKVLAMLAEEVPYWEAIQQAESKLDHVTASVRGHEYIPLLPDDLSLARGHIGMNGFTDQKTISDSRFRLVSALREAGLQQSAAAQQAVQRLFPRPQLAIHGII
mmetsp:Transcript_1565/g.2187  ORF Transcript_1565/g.2187 Transcript_1565/m.2187 type:complete len:658 (+) Transcript_1565:66-2039(+)